MVLVMFSKDLSFVVVQIERLVPDAIMNVTLRGVGVMDAFGLALRTKINLGWT